jgi:tellurite resistance protein TerC
MSGIDMLPSTVLLAATLPAADGGFGGAPLWFWVAFNSFILVVLLFDLGVLTKRDRPIPVNEALWRSFAFFVMAMIFAAGVFTLYGNTPEERSRAGLEFLTGYLIEWSLSVDNIFVFVLLFTHFQVPPAYQHRVLFWGIIGALVMRGVMIFAGTALLQNFDWIMIVFGLFLIYSGFKMIKAVDAKPDLENNPVLRFMKARYRVTDGYRGDSFFVREKGLLHMTPLFLVLVLIELTDLVFALDSIPAIFAITKDPFIVYTANVFAILGLRAMYFALAGVVHRFHYLKYGLSIVLMIVGAKMLANYWAGGKAVPVEYALALTVLIIGGSIVLSLVRTRGQPATVAADHAMSGWVPLSPARPDEDRRDK